jgi:uncharacterized protein YabN with tetrapyrrole methylase and pyrophosphatase domain
MQVSVRAGCSSGSEATAAIERPASLTVVGTGIRAGTQLTPEARIAFEQADVAFYLVANPVEATLLQEIRGDARSLYDYYEHGVQRQKIYERITEAMLAEVRRGQAVCAAFYGHPGIFVYPSHEAVRRARDEGYRARMLPAVSAEDCLFADLGVDPGAAGCQGYEATDFLIRRREVDPTAALILWQIAVIGEAVYSTTLRRDGLAVLAQYLRTWYEADHQVTLYEASPYPLVEAAVATMALADLPGADATALSTLYVPPLEPRPRDPEMMKRLGLCST